MTKRSTRAQRIERLAMAIAWAERGKANILPPFWTDPRNSEERDRFKVRAAKLLDEMRRAGVVLRLRGER